MSMMKECKEFAMRGNVVDLAVGVIIGGAFGQIVGSFVKEEAPPAAATTTKECPECLMTIPVNAKRCGHCAVVVK